MNSFLDGIKMGIRSLMFNVIRNSVYHCLGSKDRPQEKVSVDGTGQLEADRGYVL